MDENATSSSSIGAMPVHSDSRQPRKSSSSAIARSCCSSAFTSLLQTCLDRVAVDAAVLEVELVGPVLDVADLVARHEPEGDRLAAAAVLLTRPRLREVGVGSDDRAGVLERLALPLAPEDLEDRIAHAAKTTSRTHCSCSRKRFRSASRSSVFGPWPVTT